MILRILNTIMSLRIRPAFCTVKVNFHNLKRQNVRCIGQHCKLFYTVLLLEVRKYRRNKSRCWETQTAVKNDKPIVAVKEFRPLWKMRWKT
ncbi:hypothetical protein M430DRAFT_186462 [Amorphotheca resinae ATCC 22711]|uniref:Uncharacterized protein n=1 Tax=Amorphotheca resinae ATCC 22711 TaxID=857342 RepID=A0A2T3AQJ2_AMORE|nr:hypothetical protein M430DRAFT_186462 [Amorphotheca resinae ATCC 22711]PSS08534.1 hypothetical protein M430DRAFT_186462 [Amorphotheca resinae ATCC 22711]